MSAPCSRLTPTGSMEIHLGGKMKKRGWVWLVLAVLGTSGAAALFWPVDAKRFVMPPVSLATSTVTGDDLTRAAKTRLFFGHMSVGENMLTGIDTLYSAHGISAPAIVEVGPDATAGQRVGGVVLHAHIGENGDPLGKLKNFDARMRGGLAGQVNVALLKFCYIDFDSATDAEALFSAYRQTLDALERDFPNVTFLHATAPLMVAPTGPKERMKALLRGDPNTVRERYNRLVRGAYPGDRLVDIAAIESTGPDGDVSGALYPGFSTDGGHLNETGSALVAGGLVRALARVAS